MTRSDIGTILIIYATSLLFFWMTMQLKAAAQIYPMCLIGGLALLNTLYLLRCIFRMLKERQEHGSGGILNDLPEIFKGFEPGQFFFVVGACLCYMVMLYYIGFYPAGLVYLLVVMWRLKVKRFQLGLTLVFMGVLVYTVFTMFLKVPLPKGLLFS